MSFPPVMRNAHDDLTATLEGQFSPEDWTKILQRAQSEWTRIREAHPTLTETEAWQEVVRDFYQSRYWNFKANFKAPKRPKTKKNLGATFIWMGFNSLVTFKVAVLWFGQIYTRSDDPKDKWIFFAMIALIVGNFAFFLWKNHDHPD